MNDNVINIIYCSYITVWQNSYTIKFLGRPAGGLVDKWIVIAREKYLPEAGSDAKTNNDVMENEWCENEN